MLRTGARFSTTKSTKALLKLYWLTTGALPSRPFLSFEPQLSSDLLVSLRHATHSGRCVAACPNTCEREPQSQVTKAPGMGSRDSDPYQNASSAQLVCTTVQSADEWKPQPSSLLIVHYNLHAVESHNPWSCVKVAKLLSAFSYTCHTPRRSSFL